jgi:NAD(P)-dependent dehydrogenase (short-subunit alcohol dehydrogenase family)
VYNASKGGVNLLMKNIANDYGRHNIRCNSVCPGNS